jgi:flavorubredoxin
MAAVSSKVWKDRGEGKTEKIIRKASVKIIQNGEAVTVKFRPVNHRIFKCKVGLIKVSM